MHMYSEKSGLPIQYDNGQHGQITGNPPSDPIDIRSSLDNDVTAPKEQPPVDPLDIRGESDPTLPSMSPPVFNGEIISSSEMPGTLAGDYGEAYTNQEGTSRRARHEALLLKSLGMGA